MPSRQSSPRTWRVVSSIATSSTIVEAIGFGRTGERSAKVPLVRIVLNGVCNTKSRRALHPIEDLDAPVTGEPGQRRPPALVDDDRADWSVEAAAFRAFLARAPGRVDRADKVQTGIRLRRQRDRDLAWTELAFGF